MKKTVLAFAAAAALLSACTGTTTITLDPVEKPSWFEDEAYFESLNTLYEDLPLYTDNIVMVGDDYVFEGNWAEFFSDTTIKNRGIKYDGTEHVLYRIDKIAAAHPEKIFVSAGFNDIRTGKSVKSAEDNVKAIFARIAAISPDTKCYFININTKEDEAKKFNEDVKAFAADCGFEYIDICSALKPGIDSGEFGVYGGHLTAAGYAALANCLEPYIGRSSEINVAGKAKSTDYYDSRENMFESLKTTTGWIFMVGDEYVQNAPWVELFPFSPVVTRGIAGDNIKGVTDRVGEFAADRPNKVFLMVGAHDLEASDEQTVSSVWTGYEKLLQKMQGELNTTTVYVMSVLPKAKSAEGSEAFNAKVNELNKMLSAAGERYNFFYLDMASILADEDGYLKDQYTKDGVNLNSDGYYRCAAELLKGARFIAINIPR